MGYKLHAIRGISWMTLLRGSTRGITFVRLAILARILTPAQFGSFGVATLVLSFLEIITETGINVFLVQKKDDWREYINSAWIISILRGFIIFTVLIILAPFISDFFNSSQSQKLIYLIAIVPLIKGFINPSIIQIQKEIQFKKEFYLRLILFLVESAFVIILAIYTKDASSFAYGLIASAILEVVLSFVLFKPVPILIFDFTKIKQIFKRGSWITLTGIFIYLSENLDNMLVGKILGTGSLGFYQMGYKVSTFTISEIAEVVNKVTFPVYSKLSGDFKRLSNAFVKVFLTSSFFAISSGIILFIFAEPIVKVGLGKDWTEIVGLIRILSIYGILRTMFGNFFSLFFALEKQFYSTISISLRLLVLSITIIPFIQSFGIIGAGYAMIISVIFEIPLLIFLTYKIFKNQ